jgi:tripartite-type tricarboxylate transporter receptor subunit TctC
LSFASAGVGTSTHISAEKFRLSACFDAVHIPFKSTTEAITEILGGRMHYTNTALTTALPGVRDNRLVALAMSSRRSTVLPNVPTIAEAGYPEGLYASWVGMVIASKTPREVINRVHQEVIKALAMPELRDQLAKIAADVWTMTPEEFDAMRRREVADTQKLVKAVGIKVQ